VHCTGNSGQTHPLAPRSCNVYEWIFETCSSTHTRTCHQHRYLPMCPSKTQCAGSPERPTPSPKSSRNTAFWQTRFIKRLHGKAERLVTSAAMGWPTVESGAWNAVREQFTKSLDDAADIASEPDLLGFTLRNTTHTTLARSFCFANWEDPGRRPAVVGPGRSNTEQGWRTLLNSRTPLPNWTVKNAGGPTNPLGDTPG
jgi:hypothetical protein